MFSDCTSTSINCFHDCNGCVFRDDLKVCCRCGRRCHEIENGAMTTFYCKDRDPRIEVYCDDCLAMADPVFVYFIQDTRCGDIKIGKSKNPEKRLNEVTPQGIILATILDPTGGQLERELHSKFDHINLYREWFAPTKELLFFIKCNQGRPDLKGDKNEAG
jgi:hypothetical protein